ncbi:MAG: Stk1 family PASTA domain-containing Ser/Thr kinase [Bacilli bacterium]|nr:Stk1 family PASTA domain-containing Ser/Thr kinase [Bacilli bacterium]
MIVKGQKINDRYQIIKTIGEGGMANVYLAYDTILDRNVAVKVLRGDLATDEKFVRRFQREALSASSLSHPNIVEVYDVGEDNGSYYIVMEYIEGKQLKQMLKKRGKLTLNEVVDIMSQVTDGMSAAHDSYIIHRDIKPQNIMILENGLIKITDFGIAMALNSTQLTQTNSVMGSVHYLPPEQASGKGATIQSDVYSMGILMYELLTGELPFRGDNAVEIALKQIKEPVPSVRDKIESIPQSIENIIIKATAKNPKNRYADAREMHDDLKTALSKERENEPKYTFKYHELENENIKKSEVRTTPVPTDADLKKSDKLKKAANKNQEDTFLDKFAETEEIKATKIEDKPKKKKDGDQKKSENKLLMILGIVFTALIVLFTAIVLILPKFTQEKEIKIPDVKNLTAVEAEAKLEEAGLAVESSDDKYEESADVEEGKVTRTSPQIGRTVKKGSTITLYISTGQGGVVLDDYTGQNRYEIQGILKEKQIFVEVKKEEPEDYSKVTGDQILRQEPAKGTVVRAGDTVTLYIPDMNTTYPDFTEASWSLTKIQEWCDKYSVTFANPQYDMTNDYPEGAIYKQYPAPGTRVQTGQTLKINVAENFDDSVEGTGTGEE